VTEEDVKQMHNGPNWPACCCIDNEVSGELSPPPQGPFDGCPCVHYPGSDPCSYYTRQVTLVFEPVAHEDYKNPMTNGEPEVDNYFPRLYTQADCSCTGNGSTAFSCYTEIRGTYADFACDGC
jgi:hypothetical protein